MTLTPAFYRAHGGRKLGVFIEGVGLRLKRGAADLPSFERALRLVAGDHPFATPNAERTKIQEPIRLQARALSLAAALAAVALVLFLAQALVRLVGRGSRQSLDATSAGHDETPARWRLGPPGRR